MIAIAKRCRWHRLLTSAAGVCMWAVPAIVVAQLTPINYADDHFLCYKGKLSASQASASGQHALSLLDAFELGGFDLRKELGSCNPANKNGEGIVDPAIHLTSYKIKKQSGQPPHAKQKGVRMVNQFGEIILDTKKPNRILIPASKDDNPASPLPAPPVFANHNVDHYKCYAARITKGTNAFPGGFQATVEDQWETDGKLYELKKLRPRLLPKLLCLAVDKNGEGIKNANANLVCYQAQPAKGEPKHVKRVGVGFADQFIAHRLDSRKEELLCVPSLVDPPAEFCGDGVVNQGGLEDCDGDDAPCLLGESCTAGCQCVAPSYCGDGTVDPGEQCEANADCAAGTTCTGACTCIDSQCPSVIGWTRFAKAGVMNTNTDYDSGWTGSAHNNGIADFSTMQLNVSAVSGSGPASCGVATIEGYHSSGRLCRCNNDNRQLCDQLRQPDFDDCGGDICQCYFDAPTNAVTGNFPTCSVVHLSEDVTGTWNVDTGEGRVRVSAEQSGNFGEGLLDPCPTCDGDATANDGVRGGTCSGGLNAGQSCDAQIHDPTFPAPGGGYTSLDCFPGGALIAQGIFVDHDMTTGSVSLPPVVPCGIGDAFLCPCGACDANEQIPCTSNADCGADGPCRSVSVLNPQPNACGDGICTTLEPSQGECQGDPPILYCDGLLRAEGTGILQCSTNADCVPPAVLINAGNCTLPEFDPCFPTSIALTGTPDTTSPYVVSAVCQGVSNSPGANTVAGYPGPGVRQVQLGLTLQCAGDPGSTYPACP